MFESSEIGMFCERRKKMKKKLLVFALTFPRWKKVYKV